MLRLDEEEVNLEVMSRKEQLQLAVASQDKRQVTGHQSYCRSMTAKPLPAHDCKALPIVGRQYAAQAPSMAGPCFAALESASNLGSRMQAESILVLIRKKIQNALRDVFAPLGYYPYRPASSNSQGDDEIAAGKTRWSEGARSGPVRSPRGVV